MVAAVVEHGSFQIDLYHELTADKARIGDHYYSEKAPLPSLVMIPFWWLVTTIGLSQPGTNGLLTESLLRWSGFICASIPLALIMLWTWRRLRLKQLPITDSWMAMLPFLGSFLFVYSGSFYGHLIAGMFVLFAWDRTVKGDFFVAGIFSSAAVLCEYSLFVFPMIWCIQLLVMRRWNTLKDLVIGGLPAVLVLLAINWSITSDPFSLAYSQVDSHADTERLFGLAFPSLEALAGLLISPFRGMFVFAPVSILCTIVIFQRIGKMSLQRIFRHPLILPSVILILMIASHSMWWGGWAIGPRHLTTVAILVLAAGLPLLANRKSLDWIFIVLCFLGVAVNFAAKNTIGYSAPTEIKDPINELILPAFFEGRFTEGQLPVLAGIDPTASTIAFFLIFVLSLIALRVIDRKMGSRL